MRPVIAVGWKMSSFLGGKKNDLEMKAKVFNHSSWTHQYELDCFGACSSPRGARGCKVSLLGEEVPPGRDASDMTGPGAAQHLPRSSRAVHVSYIQN